MIAVKNKMFEGLIGKMMEDGRDFFKRSKRMKY